MFLVFIAAAFAFIPFTCFASGVTFSQKPRAFNCNKDEISFLLDLKIDMFGNETSWSIINVVEGSVVDQGFGYLQDQKYVEHRCLPCGPYNFTIHDSYGDGLTYGFDSGYNITVDEVLVKVNSGTQFASESTFFHGGPQCPDISPTPSLAPTLKTCHDDEISFVLDLTTDNFGYETSWSIINVAKGTVVEEGFGYLSKHNYLERRCLPCGSYNFTIFDSFGDGLNFGSKGTYEVTVDNELVKVNSGFFFFSDTTLFDGGAQCRDISHAPSSAPTLERCNDDEIEFLLNLTTDWYGYETSWILSNSHDNSIAVQGGNYYKPNHNYQVAQCLPCGTYNFTIYDSYGDGILSPGGYSIQIDGTVVKNFTNSSFSYMETTLLHEGSYCEKRCEDSKLKMLLVTGRLKGCHWVSKKPKKRCRDPDIVSHCPSTCGICGECMDSTLRFMDTRRGKLTRCEAVGRNPTKISRRCAKYGIKESCPRTCGVC